MYAAALAYYICYWNKLRRKVKWKFELQKEDIRLSYHSNYLCSLQTWSLSYIKEAFEQNYSLKWCYVRYIDYISLCRM